MPSRLNAEQEQCSSEAVPSPRCDHAMPRLVTQLILELTGSTFLAKAPERNGLQCHAGEWPGGSKIRRVAGQCRRTSNVVWWEGLAIGQRRNWSGRGSLCTNKAVRFRVWHQMCHARHIQCSTRGRKRLRTINVRHSTSSPTRRTLRETQMKGPNKTIVSYTAIMSATGQSLSSEFNSSSPNLSQPPILPQSAEYSAIYKSSARGTATVPEPPVHLRSVATESPGIAVPQRFGQTCEFWQEYDKAADKHDQDMVKGLGENVDVLLVFAGLFSGVNTAFVILSLSYLSASPSEETNTLLRLLVQRVDNSTLTVEDLSPPKFSPSNVAIRINCFFAASLCCSLTAAFGAMLGKQWVGRYARTGQLGPTSMQGRYRQMKFTGVEKYHFRSIVEGLPTLLQIALFFFFTGLTDFLRFLNTIVATVVFGLVVLGFISYAFTVVAAALDPYCPFQTPVSTISRRALVLIGFWFSLVRCWLFERRKAPPPELPLSRNVGPSPRRPGPRDSARSLQPPHSFPPALDRCNPARSWNGTDGVDAAAATWILETSARKEALLAAARSYVALPPVGLSDTPHQNAAFRRLVSLLKETLKQLQSAAASQGVELVDAAIVYGRAVSHTMIGKSYRSELQVRKYLAAEIDVELRGLVRVMGQPWVVRHPRVGELLLLESCLGKTHGLTSGMTSGWDICPPTVSLYIPMMVHFTYNREEAIAAFAVHSLSGPTAPSARVLGLTAWSLSILPLLDDKCNLKLESAWADRWSAYTSDAGAAVHLLAALRAYAAQAGEENSQEIQSYELAYTTLLKVIRHLTTVAGPYNVTLPPPNELLSVLEDMLVVLASRLGHWRRCDSLEAPRSPGYTMLKRLQLLRNEVLLLMVELFKRLPRNATVAAAPLWQVASLAAGDPVTLSCLFQLMKKIPSDQGLHLSLFRQYPTVVPLLCNAMIHDDPESKRGVLRLFGHWADLWFKHDELDIHRQFIKAGLITSGPLINSYSAYTILLWLVEKPIWREKMVSGHFLDMLYDFTLHEGRTKELTMSCLPLGLDVWRACCAYPEFSRSLERWTSDEMAAVVAPLIPFSRSPYLEYAKAVVERSQLGGISWDVGLRMGEAMQRVHVKGSRWNEPEIP